MSANGRLTDDELQPISGPRVHAGSRLPNAAADSFMRAAAVDDRMEIREAASYRDIALQRAMQVCPPCYGATSVASPGSSVHGRHPGCIDVYNWPAFGDVRGFKALAYSAGLDALLNPHGWFRTISTEGWHYQYDAARDRSGGGAGGGGDTGGATLKLEDNTMNLLTHHAGSNNTFRVLEDRIIQYRQNADSRNRAVAQGAIVLTQLGTGEFRAQLLVAGFPEVAANLALIEDLPEWGIYERGSVELGPADFAELASAIAGQLPHTSVDTDAIVRTLLPQLVTALDASDDDEHHALADAIAALPPSASAADFIAALKETL